MIEQDCPKAITLSAKKSLLFQDLLSFLHLLKERPLELTQTGNLRLKEIDAVHDVCKYDFYPKDDDGKLRFSIRSVDDLRYLNHLRQLAHVCKFASKRKHKLKLSKKGKEFLRLSLEDQFLMIVKAQLFYCNWSYLFPFGGRREELLIELQDQIINLIGFLLKKVAGRWRSLEQITEDVAQELGIEPALREGYFPDEDLLANAVEWLALNILEKFDLVDLKLKKEKKYSYTFIKVREIKLNSTGKYSLELLTELDPSQQTSRMPAEISADEVNEQLNTMIKSLKIEDQITSDDIKSVIYHSSGSDGSTDLIGELTPHCEGFDQMEMVVNTPQVAWNYSPHQILDDLTPHQKMMEVYAGKKVRASKPKYKSNKTKAYQLFEDSLPEQLSIKLWGEESWGVDLSHGYHQSGSELEKIHDQTDIKQAKAMLA